MDLLVAVVVVVVLVDGGQVLPGAGSVSCYSGAVGAVLPSSRPSSRFSKTAVES
jgi:hypothetical protein